MRASYTSLLLLACGAIYALFNAGGSSVGVQTSDTYSRPTVAASAEPAPGAKESASTPVDDPNLPDVGRQFEKCDVHHDCQLLDDVIAPRFVIATVPDPVATHLRVEFDRAIDGIKEAAADEKYLLRRFWLPWPFQRPPQFSDWASQQLEEKQHAAKRLQPGFLLFENADRQSLIVLLVGESPTSGIQRRQFGKAIRLKGEIENLWRSSADARQNQQASDDRLHILGTTFSGSLYTLQLALKENWTGDFEAVSGTVTERRSIDCFNSWCAGRRPAGSSLRTLRHDSVTALNAFRNYLRDAWHFNGKVAILAETDTVMGTWLDDLDSDLLLIPFPRDIAHLRNAYQSHPELSGLGSASADRQQRGLPLPLDDTENMVDVVPEFGPQTVVSQETLVSQVASRIKHEHIRFAGIVNSDVLDALFITRFMRAATPDTRFFLVEPDLLFVHSANALPFDGVLAVTTYPLLGGNPPFEERMGSRDEAHWVFPAPFQQGIHNAMRVLLAGRRNVVLPGYDVLESEDKAPALWITSVGRESFVPIAALRSPQVPALAQTNQKGVPSQSGASAARDATKPPLQPPLVEVPRANANRSLSARFPHAPPHIWWALFLLVAFAMVVLALIVGRAQHSADARLSDFRFKGGVGSQQHLALFLVFAAAIYLVVVSSGIQLPFDFGSVVYAVFSLAMIGGLFCSLWRIKLEVSGRLVVLLTAAGVAAVFILFVFLGNDRTNLAGVFFRFRSFELSSGAAPTVPFLFLFAGFLVCAFVNLQRCIFDDQRAPSLPEAKTDPVLGSNIWSKAGGLRQQLSEPFRYSPTTNILLAAVAFVACCGGLFVSGIRSFEGRLYDWTFTAWASALAAALVVVCWRFLESWSLLRRILDQLETHAIRRALSALPPDHSWSPVWQSSPRKRSYLILTRSTDALAALRWIGPSSQELTMLIDRTEQRVRVVLGEAAQGHRETLEEYADAQSALAETADHLLADLQPVWQQGSSAILAESKDAKQEHKDEVPPLVFAFEFVAMRYLAFIRYAMLQLRNMLTFLMPGFLAFAFALMSYPFAGERSIAWVITALFLVMASGTLFVFVQMGTDQTLRRITNRDAGNLGFMFFHRALVFGALPLLAVLASTFNGVGRFLFSWIEPALKTLH